MIHRDIDTHVYNQRLQATMKLSLTRFHNTMKEAIHGIPVGQVGSTCYRIIDLLTQGTNQVGTNHQETTPTSNGDVQTLQGSSEQTPGTSMNQVQYNPGPLIQHVQ